ncbi:MAG TPA: hypothetical protein VMV29_18435 [Ktedonobacterales bacterium]|nr:hypothetical protein [Ktedonobacterales bacterium]
MSETPQQPTGANNGQDATTGRDGRDNSAGQRSWDAFDWSVWGVDDGAERDANDEQRRERNDVDGADMGGARRPPRGARPGMLRPALDDLDDADDAPDAAGDGGRWVTHGGVVQWEEPDYRDVTEFPNLRDEAASSWADDDVTLPLAAPERLRVRATRAWLARRRLGESDAQGALLLERRRLYGAPADDEQTDEGAQTLVNRRRARQERAENPLDLAIAEHQAAADEYEDLLFTLEDLRTHSGADRILIEFYLLVTDRLGALANQPTAPASYAELIGATDDDDELAIGRGDWAALAALRADTGVAANAGYVVSARERREWVGRVRAALQTRRHVERVSAPEPEE